jgi:GT2 family glycosyltransferase
MSDRIHILLPVHNRREITRRFLTCLKTQTFRNYHLILIDDGSTDGTAEMVREEVQALTVITGKGDWWWAGSLQQGYQWLKQHKPPLSDIVLLINDDTEFEPDFLEKALAALQNMPRTFLQAQSYDRQTGQLDDAGIHVDWKRFSFEQASTGKPVNCMSTRGLFFRVEDFFLVGGFHPRLLPHYGSDYEFTIRARRKGMNLAPDPSVAIRLDVSSTGYHGGADTTFLREVKSVFSRKSAINPLTLAMFVALACPWPWKFLCWFRILSLGISHGWALLMRRAPAR